MPVHRKRDTRQVRPVRIGDRHCRHHVGEVLKDRPSGDAQTFLPTVDDLHWYSYELNERRSRQSPDLLVDDGHQPGQLSGVHVQAILRVPDGVRHLVDLVDIRYPDGDFYLLLRAYPRRHPTARKDLRRRRKRNDKELRAAGERLAYPGECRQDDAGHHRLLRRLLVSKSDLLSAHQRQVRCTRHARRRLVRDGDRRLRQHQRKSFHLRGAVQRHQVSHQCARHHESGTTSRNRRS